MSKGEKEGNDSKSKKRELKTDDRCRRRLDGGRQFLGRKEGKKSGVRCAGVTERNKVRGENELNLRRESEDLEERAEYEERKR